MLQKSEKGGYNQLGRRQVLKALGAGIGMIAMGTLTGCTSSLVRKLENSGSKMTALSSEEEQLLSAIARLDFQLLKGAKEEILSAIGTYQISPQALSRVYPALKQVTDHFYEVGLVDAIEREWWKVQEAFQDYGEEVLTQVIDELRRSGIPQEKLTEYWRAIPSEIIEFYPVRGEVHKSFGTLVQIMEDLVNQDSIALSSGWADCFMEVLAATLLIVWISEPALAACAACAAAPSVFNPGCWRCGAAIGISVIAVIRAIRTCIRARGGSSEIITP